MATVRTDLCTKQGKVTRLFMEGCAECGEAGGKRAQRTDPLASGELTFTSSIELSSSTSVSALRFPRQSEISRPGHRGEPRQTSRKSS